MKKHLLILVTFILTIIDYKSTNVANTVYAVDSINSNVSYTNCEYIPENIVSALQVQNITADTTIQDVQANVEIWKTFNGTTSAGPQESISIPDLVCDTVGNCNQENVPIAPYQISDPGGETIIETKFSISGQMLVAGSTIDVSHSNGGFTCTLHTNVGIPPCGITSLGHCGPVAVDCPEGYICEEDLGIYECLPDTVDLTPQDGIGDICGYPVPSTCTPDDVCIDCCDTGGCNTDERCIKYTGPLGDTRGYCLQDPVCDTGIVGPPPYDGPIIDFDSLLRYAYELLQPVVVLFIGLPRIIYSGYKLKTSDGDPAKIKQGKSDLGGAISATLLAALGVTVLRVGIQLALGITI